MNRLIREGWEQGSLEKGGQRLGRVVTRVQGNGWLGGILGTKGLEQNSNQVSPGRMEAARQKRG